MTQNTNALLRLREEILTGTMRPGERVTEVSAAERLGVSRTPIRAALARLEDENLLEAIQSGGYAVRKFEESEARDAIQLRGVLEGLAARLAAERGVGGSALAGLRALVDEMDALATSSTRAAHPLSEAGFEVYALLNGRFHARLIELADSTVLQRQIGRVLALPFGSYTSFVRAQSVLPEAHAIFAIAQDQHRGVTDAIEAREGSRAEALMREHARLADRILQLAMHSKAALRLIPGSPLLQRQAGR